MNDKTFILKYSEASQSLFKTVNEMSSKFGLPFYMIETILQELLYEVKMQSKLEYDAALATVSKQNEGQMTIEEAAKNNE